jgi:hypothetical protein
MIEPYTQPSLLVDIESLSGVLNHSMNSLIAKEDRIPAAEPMMLRRIE